MIARIINWCVSNRGMTLLLALCLAGAGAWGARTITVDAIPDLSDVQVVIRSDYPGQAPRIIEDQVTYPLTTAMLAVPGAETVRGYSMFGSSFVYIIFEDGTDLYWARSRVLEQLATVRAAIPDGVSVQLGPDATGVGWVFQYMLVTGPYCPKHPDGLWRDPQTGDWFETADNAPPDARPRLERHRIFDADTLGETLTVCPIDGEKLRAPDSSLADLRGIQDWRLRYELTAVPGVSEVASIGGFVKQYQVTADPVRLLAYNIPLKRVHDAIARSNIDVGGRVIELAETEYMVRGLGYLGTLSEAEIAAGAAAGRSVEQLRTARTISDLETIALGADAQGRPVYLRDVAHVSVGPDIRRGIAEWNGEGEAVGAFVIMRFGANARRTIAGARARLDQLESSLPPGVAVRVGYDRSDLIDRAVHTLDHTLIEEIIVVSIVVTIFLLHLRSALIAVVVLPLGVLAALLVMRLLGASANIMSLGGLAISIGVMVDSSMIMVENAHKHLEHARAGGAPAPRGARRAAIIADAAKEVGPSLFFALLIFTVSFLPIFSLTGESGRLFRPLALTLTLALLSSAILAITLIAVLMVFFMRERVVPATLAFPKRLAIYLGVIGAPAAALALVPLGAFDAQRPWFVLGWILISAAALLPQRIVAENRSPLNRGMRALYEPFFATVMRWRWLTLFTVVLVVAGTTWPLRQLGSEFMPPLEEGDLLFMPSVDPGISATKARELLQQTDRLLRKFPEVRTVFGKVGRADTATDPAPLTMIETTIQLERDKSKWRTRPVTRFFDDWPALLARPLAAILPGTRPITLDELIYGYDGPAGAHVPGMNDALNIPGLTNSWTMPIRARIDMLSTGIKTPVGIKVMGEDLPTLTRIAQDIADALRTDAATSASTTSAFAEKTVGGKYLNITIDREAIARQGLALEDVQNVIATALGGSAITETVEGLERYPVNLRYAPELRDTPAALEQTLVSAPSGAQTPLSQLASFAIAPGPPMIKTENARPTAWVYVNIAHIDLGTYVHNAQQVVARRVKLPTGYTILWSGQYEQMQEASRRLVIILPLTLIAIVLLLYLATRSWLRVSIVLLALPFSLVGAIWLLYFMDYHLSLAVVVGLIALAGLDAETGLVMLLYLDTSVARFRREGRLRNADDLWWAIHDGAVQRLRPKLMTVSAVLAGLLPLLWATGAGADTMRRLAVPMIGGVTTSFLLELLVYPVLFYSAMRIALRREATREREYDAPASAATA